MAFTPRTVIEQARYITNDTSSTNMGFDIRQTDEELLTYVNDGLRDMAILSPMVFSTVGTYACTPDTVEQSLSYSTAVRLLDVIRVQGGLSLRPFDRAMLDRFRPDWRNATPGPAAQWSPKENDPLVFYLDKPAPAGQMLDVQFVRNPQTYTIEQPITDIPESLSPALSWYVVFKAESKDDENVLGNRAQMAYQMFREKLGMPVNAAA